MLKTIGYAYASSATATRLGAGRDGCYFVAMKRAETDHIDRNLRGPFPTIEAAEAHAEVIDADWSRYSLRVDRSKEGWREMFA